LTRGCAAQACDHDGKQRTRERVLPNPLQAVEHGALARQANQESPHAQRRLRRLPQTLSGGTEFLALQVRTQTQQFSA
jgi:hypothetical protein